MVEVVEIIEMIHSLYCLSELFYRLFRIQYPVSRIPRSSLHILYLVYFTLLGAKRDILYPIFYIVAIRVG